ncbi:MAG TPA: DinB family protein [Dehalococcoidia bacterium]|nr:DinB family protein [Dehalococcoidia bacterium]
MLSSVDVISSLVEYAYWARDRILDAARLLSAEEYRAPAGLDHGSIGETLAHTFAAERLWRLRLECAGDALLPDQTGADSVEALQAM